MPTLIYHNPNCSNSRNTLALIEASGETPEIVEYLDTPPSREELTRLLDRMGMPPRDLLRKKEKTYTDLGLDDPTLTDAQLIDAMAAHPVLLNRPIVVTDKGARLCRPPERVLDLLASPVVSFTKENGDVVTHTGNTR